jgi:hypothetical protein
MAGGRRRCMGGMGWLGWSRAIICSLAEGGLCVCLMKGGGGVGGWVGEWGDG